MNRASGLIRASVVSIPDSAPSHNRIVADESPASAPGVGKSSDSGSERALVQVGALAKAILKIDLFSGSDALNELAAAALDATRSRHAMIAVFLEEQGWLEIKYAAGPDAAEAIGHRLDVDDSSGIVSYVAATGRSYTAGDVQSEPRYRKIFDSTVSELAVPVRDSFNRVFAVLNLESDRKDAFGDEERDICLALGRLASTVFELERREVRESALIQIGHALDSALTEEGLIGEVVHVAAEVLRFQAASVFIRDVASETFVLRGSTSRLNTQVGQIRYQPGEGCTGWVCGNGKSILIHEPQNDPRWRGRYVEFPSGQIASFLCVPVMVSGRPEGAVRVIRRKADNPFIDNRFTDDDLRLMEAIAEQVGSGIQNIRSVDRMLRGERMIAWGELSAKSSHMIGNRVFAVRGDINELKYLLQADQPKIGELRATTESLGVNVTRIEEILQDFRDFISATQLTLEPADISQMLRETIQEVFPKRTPVKCTLILEPELPPVMADLKRLRRAFSELIENSLMYAAENDVNPVLTIGARGAESSKSPARRMVEVFVADTGPGVPIEDKRRIFEPFYTGRVKGMGLGLSIVKGIVEAHGGEVAEVGEQGKGATFLIRLPAAERP